MTAPNVPRALEGATAATLQQTADLATMPRIRTGQAVDADGRWSPAADRVFPLYDLRAAPPTLSEEAGATLLCPVEIQISTLASDDKTHEKLGIYYATAQQVIDRLYAQYRNAGGTELDAFNTYLSDKEPVVDDLIAIGGFSHGNGLGLFEEDGVNVMGITLIVHYSRADY
jgi:hypothetical protein